MKILNFGSLNIDYVYHVDHFVTAGETTGSLSMDKNVGGKGLNQSVAFAKAGASVFHAGCIGNEGEFLTDYLKKTGVNTDYIKVKDVPTGNAVIQVDKHGQNCILLFSGANAAVTEEQIDAVLSDFSKGDMVILQNEISNVGYIIEAAHKRGLVTVLNPSPISEKLLQYPLSLVNWFIMNEIEGCELTGKSDKEQIIAAMRQKYPAARCVLTLGKHGAVYFDAETACEIPAGKGKPVDTTAAGDTFTGYFFTGIASGKSPEEAMRFATKASDITVTRKGAAESIPFVFELDEY